MGKSAIDEQHPNFVGTYMGKLIDPETSRIVESADLVIALGPILGDTNSASYSVSIDLSKAIEIQHDHTMVCRAGGVLIVEKHVDSCQTWSPFQMPTIQGFLRTLISVHCRHCESDQVVKRGKTE